MLKDEKIFSKNLIIILINNIQSKHLVKVMEWPLKVIAKSFLKVVSHESQIYRWGWYYSETACNEESYKKKVCHK